MQINPSTSKDRANLVQETLINETDKISKVSRHSVASGLSYGVAKVAGKAEKDIMLAMSEMFPSLAYETALDQAARNFGITERFGAFGSSTYVRVKADPGTTYIAGTHNFISTEGPTFVAENDYAVPQEGFGYIKVHSVDQGSRTAVGALTISRMSTAPSGHINVVNEVKAFYGADEEGDETFRARIKDSGNLWARNTIAHVEQVCMSVNPKVLKAFNYGINRLGKRVIGLLTQDGSDLNSSELDSLTQFLGDYLTLTDSLHFGNKYIGVQLTNVMWQPIDISFRVLLDTSYNPDDIRKNIQIAISKYLDLRTFNPSKQVVEWDNMLQLVKDTPGVLYVPDQYFYPRIDVGVDIAKLPRLRGFLMLDLNGTIITNTSGTLSPIYYPANADFSYISTVLQNL